MDELYRTEVVPEQIDHLGHMNVRFYAVHARRAGLSLLSSLGLETDDDQLVRQRDTYVRHHREQLVGAPLVVRGGFLDADLDRIRLYEELANLDSGEVAATFVLGFDRVDPASRERLPIPSSVLAAAKATTVTVPEHGRPRSISVDDDPTADAPRLDVLVERGLALRQPRLVDAAEMEVDEAGSVSPVAVPELMWGGEPAPGREFRPLEELPDGGTMGFATMETRTSWARLPRVGDRIQSFSAELDVREKTMLSRQWLFDVDRGDLLTVLTVVNVAFDTTKRRAIAIPEAFRLRIAGRLHPDLATDVLG